MQHTVHLKVRFAETDGMAVVYHGRYFEYFEMARVALLEEIGSPYSTLIAAGYHLPVLQAQARYLQPAKFADTLAITASLQPLTGVRLQISYQIHRGSELLVEGETTHAFVDHSGRPVKPPREFLDLIKRKTAAK